MEANPGPEEHVGGRRLPEFFAGLAFQAGGMRKGVRAEGTARAKPWRGHLQEAVCVHLRGEGRKGVDVVAGT